MKILLLENKAICIEVLIGMLGPSRIVETASTFEEAEAKLKSFKPEVILISSELWPVIKDHPLPLECKLIIFTSADFLDKAKAMIARPIMEADIERAAGKRKEIVQRIKQNLADWDKDLQERKDLGERSGIQMEGRV